MEEGKKLTIKYVTPGGDRETHPVNGAFGGMSSDGLLLVNLYFDRKSFPETMEIEHIEHNLFGNEKPLSFESDADVIREIVSRLALTPKAAVGIGKWLVKKGEEARKMTEGNIKEH